jgi:hypothetical protein
MTNHLKRIQGININSVKALKWKIDPKKNAQENLNDLLEPLVSMIKSVKNDELTINKEKETRKTISLALKELKQNIPSVLLLERLNRSKKFKEKAAALEKKPLVLLVREFLKLAEGENAIRQKSSDYDSAWEEIEGEYFLKFSLYQMELFRRE